MRRRAPPGVRRAGAPRCRRLTSQLSDFAVLPVSGRRMTWFDADFRLLALRLGAGLQGVRVRLGRLDLFDGFRDWFRRAHFDGLGRWRWGCDVPLGWHRRGGWGRCSIGVAAAGECRVNQLRGDDIEDGRVVHLALRREESGADEQNHQQQQVDSCRGDEAFLFESVHQRLGGSVRAESRVMPLRWHRSMTASTSRHRQFSSARR